jgi:SAM-dependent methyltransferase
MYPVLIHAHHNRHLEDLPLWLDLAGATGDPLLELGCGTGRVLIPLAQAGHRTVGIDHDPAMLNFIRANIESSVKLVPWLIVADMGRFHLAAQFSLILLPCNTFSTLQENERKTCLECVCKHLKPGGMFAVSVPNPELLRNLPAQAEDQMEDEFIHPQTGNPVQVSSTWRKTKTTFKVTWNYDHLLPDGRVERLAVASSHQISSIDTYLHEIRAVGLRESGIFGEYDRSAYRKDSPYFILLATV